MPAIRKRAVRSAQVEEAQQRTENGEDMSSSLHARSLVKCLPLAVALFLSACGGGGGGGGVSVNNPPPAPPPVVNRGFTASVASIDKAASVAGDESFGADFLITITDTAANQ